MEKRKLRAWKNSFGWMVVPAVLTILLTGEIWFIFTAPTEDHTFGPQTWTGSNNNNKVIYVLYNARYGQLNNQIQSLVYGLSHVRELRRNRGVDAKLVLPLTFTGKESSIEATFRDYKKLSAFKKVSELVRDYLDEASLTDVSATVPFADFLKVVNETGPEIYDYSIKDLDKDATNFYIEVVNVPGLLPNTNTQRRIPACNYTLATELYDSDPRAGVILLPKIFTPHYTNCTESFSYWLNVRRNIVPREELRRTITEYFNTIPHPITGIHLRVIGDEEVSKVTNESLIASFENNFKEQLDAPGTVYVAYTPGQESVRIAMSHLRERYPHIRTCADMPNCGEEKSEWAAEMPEEQFLDTFRSVFSTALIDTWALVEAHSFYGRRASSMAYNIHWWRKLSLGRGSGTTEQDQWFELF